MPKRSKPAERKVQLFRNGRNQSVRIPREFELPGKEAILRKEGKKIIIEPAPRESLLELLATLKTLPPEHRMPEIEDYAPEEIDL